MVVPGRAGGESEGTERRARKPVPAERWTDDFLDSLRVCGDPPADEAVAAYFDAVGGEHNRLMSHLMHTGTVPDQERTPAVEEFLHGTPELAPWCDVDAVRRTERLFDELGPQLLWVIGALSFPASYAGAKHVRVLALTARLESDTKRRIMETLQMVLDSFQPGGILPGGPGYHDARRVRLMHAGIRWLILHDPRVSAPASGPPLWDTELGVPISQESLAGFLLPLTVTALDGLNATGVRLTDREANDYIHTWCVIGSLMGCRDDLLPMDRESADAFAEALQRRYYEPSADGRAMEASHLEMLESMMPPGLRGLPRTFMRQVMDSEVLDWLGVGNANWTRILFDPLRAVARTTWALERHSHLVGRISGYAGRSIIKGFVELERGGSRPNFNIPTALAPAFRSSRLSADRVRAK